MAQAVGSEVRPGIGTRLKAGRERKGLTLLQLAEKLHIDPKVLEALETDRFEELGAPVYVRGHLKRYSELVGESTSQLLDEYAALTKPGLPDLTQLPKASRQSDPGRLVLPSLVVLIGFALVGTVWWVLQNFNSKVTFGKPVTPHSLPATSDLEGTPAVPPEQVPAEANRSPPTGVPAGERALRDNGAPARGGVASPATMPVSTQPAQASPAATAEPEKPGLVDVRLKFTADSWVEVYDASGRRLFYDIGAANSSRSVSGAPPLRVVLGNAPGVALTINGKAATVPPNTLRQDTAQFTINRSGHIVRTRPEGAASPESKPNGE